MVRDELVPYLTRRFGTRSPGCALTLRFVGVGQSQIDQTLKEHVPLDRDIILNSVFEASRVDFTFSLPIDSAEDRVRLRQLEEKILRHLGEFVYADDGSSLEDVVVAALRGRGATLAVVEIGSGGALAASLNLAKNASEVVKAALVASSEAQAKGLVRSEAAACDEESSEAATLKALAGAIQALAGANAAVVVGEVKPGSAGAGSIEVFSRLNGLSGEVRRLSVRGSDSASRSALTTQILDHLRRQLGVKIVARPAP
jgi:nicotinamide-nucleotide amidase